MEILSLMRRERSSTFLCVLEVFPGSRHLLEFTRGSFVHLALGKVRQFSFLPSSRELFTCVALLFLSAWDDPITFLPYPITPRTFLQEYMLGPIHFLWPNCFLGLRLGWGIFHSPQV